MTINEIKELIQLIDQTSINDFQYQKDGYKIKIRKNAEGVQTASTGKTREFEIAAKSDSVKNTEVTANSEEATKSEMAVTTETVISKASEEKANKTNSGGVEVKSPLVGVYYGSPSPTSPSFVAVGQTVKKGDVLCIVEAMKIMNEIVAETDGMITEICVENETLVEFGQPLVKIG